MRLYYILIAAVLFAACKSSRPSRPNFGQGSEDGTPEDPNDFPGEEEEGGGSGGGSGGSGGGSGGSGGGSGGTDATLNLITTRSIMRVNSFEILVNKLKFVTAQAEDSDAIKAIRQSAQSLGGYDYAQGIIPENKWNADKMVAWFNGVDLACKKKELTSEIAKADGDKAFLEKAYGRDILPAETAFLKEIKLTGDKRARVICVSILTSGEFISL